jgi:hypothetical protein
VGGGGAGGTGGTGGAGGAGSSATSGVQASPAPSLPLRLRATLIANFSQPGYAGGNVNTSFTADCSLGPSKQLISTTYGNFHTVEP